MGAGQPPWLLRSQLASQGHGLGGREFHSLCAGFSVLANTLALGYALNLAASIMGACPWARGV
eukprot:12627845-Heterocapsa_arctica.AAC.1